MKVRTRLLALLLVVCFVVSFASISVFATGMGSGDPGAGGGDAGMGAGDPGAGGGDAGMGGDGMGGGDMMMAESNVPTGNQVEGNWVYECTQMDSPSGDMSMDDFMQMMMSGTLPINATILWGAGEEKTGNVVMLPGNLGGYDVTVIGNGAQNISSNNKTNDVYVLIPEGVTTLAGRMIYDYNSVSGWSIPSTVSSISTEPASFLSCAGTFYGVSGSAAETYAASDATRDFVTYDADGSKVFTVMDATELPEDSEEPAVGYIQPNGTYNLPSGMLDGKHSITFSVVADYQYKIASLTVDGAEVADAAGKNEYELDYTFTSASSGITVIFEEDPNDSRNPDDLVETYDYDAPEINKKAVADGAELPENVNEYLGVNTGATAKYVNTMGISTGLVYAADGKCYEMVESYQNTEAPEYMSLAEAINGVYESYKKVYGKDYDLIRVYNYYENVTSGPSRGVVSLYCTYLYKEIDVADVPDENTVDNSHTNTASVFVQQGGDLTLDNFTSYCYTSSKGPSEAGNFFGMGSAIHVDGGDADTPADTIIYKATSTLHLNNPQILGTNNSIYATASGVIYIEGGNVFSCSSGGHGPYVSTGGEILLNTDGTDLVNDAGEINRDAENLTATTRPSSSLGTMVRDGDAMVGSYEEHADDVTVIVTGDEAGTALATDSGGGVIVANQVVTKTFGLRCAGVYSIGYDESWVYCYNSSLTSYLDAGLCSASGGYIYAYNCDISGVMGMKARAGGNSDSEETGVYVTNSRVAAYFDADEMASAYDVADPDTMQALIDSGEIDLDSLGTGYSQLNMFIDKANTPKFYEDSLDWWFTDKSKTPGYSGGNKFAVMYVENSSTPMYVTASKLVNQNYVDYGDASKLPEGSSPADNLLLSVEGAGAATVYFTDENDQTKWDLTGESDDTTELVGDIFLGAYSDAAGDPNIGTGANSASLYFDNSQWEGTILYGDEGDPTGIANLSFDRHSSWKVTADTVVADLEIYNVENITADEPVTVTFTSTSTVVAGTYGNVTLEGPGVDEWPVLEEEPEEAPAEEPEASVVEESVVEEAPAAEESEPSVVEEPVAVAESDESSSVPVAGIAAGAAVVVLAAAGIGIGVSKKKKK